MTTMTSAARSLGLAAPGAHRKPSGRYRATGPATTKFGIPVPKLRDLLRPRLPSRPIRVALGAALLSVWLVACGGPTSGTVVRRSFTPAHTDVIWSCVQYNKSGWCTLSMPNYYPVADEWDLYITNPKDGEGWVQVSKDEYDQATPGMHWSEKGGLTQ